MTKDAGKPDYGNWFPWKTIMMLWLVTAAILAVGILGFALHWNAAVSTVLITIGLISCAASLYMTAVRNAFSFEGGCVMARIHGHLISRLGWDGRGKLLDVGCGSGALSIRLAKDFPDADITGIDYWGAVWDYAKEMCEENARLEGVNNAHFLKGDARKLDFPDGSFDAVVSNFVFHEVKTEPDKRKLMRESLRVLRKGGVFCFHDLMEKKMWYGDMDEFAEELRKEGFSEVHYEAHTEKEPFIPAFLRTPIMFNANGMLWGRK